ncbi:O-antigen ligase family protein [bacterium]|nr:O-antigen ligase family protein [bacterium]
MPFSSQRLADYLDHLSRLALGSLLVVLPWIIDVRLFVVATDEGRYLKIEWTVAVVLLLFAVRTLCRSGRAGVSLFTLGFYLFVLVHVVGLLAGSSGVTSFHREMFFRYATLILVAPLLYHLLRDYEDLGMMRVLVLVGALLPTLYGLWQQLIFAYPIPNLAWWRDPMGWEPNQLLKSRIVSTFGNPNYFGSYTAAAFLFLSPLAIRHRKNSLRLGALVALLLGMLVCIYTTKSRGAVMALIVGGFGMLWFGAFLLSRRGHRWAVRGGIILAMLLVLVGFMYKGRQATGQESLIDRIGEGLQGRSPSINNRMVLWQAALALWSERPLLGAGLEEFSIQFIPTLQAMLEDPAHDSYRVIVANMESIYATNAHNEYLQVLAELGLLGAGVFLFFNVAILWGLVRILRERARRRLRRSDATFYVLGTIGAMLAVLTDAAVSFPLRLPVNAFYFYFFCGIGLALIRRLGGDVVLPLPAQPRAFWRPAAALCLLFSGGAVLASWGREYPARHFFYLAKLEVDKLVKNELEAEREARRQLYRVLDFSPDHGEAHFLLARVLGTTTEFAEAQRELRLAAKTWGNPGVDLQSGNLYFVNNELARAREKWQKLADLHPKMERIHYMIGLTYYRAGNLDRAREEFETDLKYHSDQEYAKEVYFYLGEIARMKEEWSKAEGYYYKTLNKSKHHFYAHLRLAELYSGPIENPKAMLDHVTEAERLARLSRDTQVLQEFEKSNREIKARAARMIPNLRPRP